MSITITGEFASPQQARQAAQKLRRRGYTVSGKPQARDGVPGSTLLVAHPFGAPGGNTFGNSLMGATAGFAICVQLTYLRQPLMILAAGSAMFLLGVLLAVLGRQKKPAQA